MVGIMAPDGSSYDVPIFKLAQNQVNKLNQAQLPDATNALENIYFASIATLLQPKDGTPPLIKMIPNALQKVFPIFVIPTILQEAYDSLPTLEDTKRPEVKFYSVIIATPNTSDMNGSKFFLRGAHSDLVRTNKELGEFIRKHPDTRVVSYLVAATSAHELTLPEKQMTARIAQIRENILNDKNYESKVFHVTHTTQSNGMKPLDSMDSSAQKMLEPLSFAYEKITLKDMDDSKPFIDIDTYNKIFAAENDKSPSRCRS